MKSADEAAFRLVATGSQNRLLRTAYGLTGNAHDSEDLVQTALVKLYGAWPLRDPGAVDPWLSRTMVRAWIDETRRPWWRREHPTDSIPETAVRDTDTDGFDPVLVRCLTGLPPRQRACLVLRYLDDYSVEQTADLLGCSIGTVTSHTSRGAAAVRKSYAEQAEKDPEMPRPGRTP